jgi:hypothetical protein
MPRPTETKTDLEIAAVLFELWRLCASARCRRARACCGEARDCCEKLLAWSEILETKDKSVGLMEAIHRLRGGSDGKLNR